jgi:ribosomal protein S27E
MADVDVVCRSCGAKNTFSEFTRPESRICGSCGKSLADAVQGPQRLKLKTKTLDNTTTLSGTKIEQSSRPIDTVAAVKSPRVVQGERRPSLLAGILVFLALGGAILAAQYVAGDRADVRAGYLTGRWVLLGAAFLLAILDAFYESQVKGFLCLFIPFYIVFHVVSSMDSFWKQSVFFSAMLLLGTELYFLPDEALLKAAEARVNRSIEQVGHLIERAGEAPLPQ